MIRASKSWLFFFLFLLALATGRAAIATDQEEPPTEWRFGVIESYEAPDKATELGVAWTRLPFHWAEVQSGGPDSWTPAVSDEQLEAVSARLLADLPARLQRAEHLGDDSGGAAAARVHDYVDMMLSDFFSDTAREQFLLELDQLLVGLVSDLRRAHSSPSLLRNRVFSGSLW